MTSRNRSRLATLVGQPYAVAVILAVTAARAQGQTDGVAPVPEAAQAPKAKTPEVDVTAVAPAAPAEVAPPASGQGSVPPGAGVAAPGLTATHLATGDGSVEPTAATGTSPGKGAPAPDSDADTSAEDAAAETAMEARDAAADLSPDATKLTAYGFADFSYSRRFDNRSTNFVGNRLPSFYVGNFNLYLGGELGSRWRALSEVRLTYLPDGVPNYSNYNAVTNRFERVSTAYPDYADYYRPRKVGGVILERVWVEFVVHPLLTIRGGQWLTPYGIWNVDHGSPVVIGVTRPYIVGNEWFPSRQTGIELYGTHGIGDTAFGYHLTISNGRGPVDSYEDLDKNKAIGWRIWARHDSPVGAFSLGTSGYKGRYTDVAVGVNATGSALQYSEVSSYRELALAADFKWTWGGYLLQVEAILHDVAYDDKLRPAIAPPAAPGWTADGRQWGFYTITGYRLPWFGVMPFVGTQYLNVGKYDAFTCWELNGGLNVRPTERIVLKAVGLWVWRPEPGTSSKSEGQFLSQVAWSF